MYIIYIYTYTFFWFQWSCCELYDGSCKGYLCSESLFTLIPPLVLDLFLAFRLFMLSPSSRRASCHFWVLYPLRLLRHTSHAVWLDVFWLLARQTPWGLLGWFLNVTSCRYQTSYILGSFNKRSFQCQINNLNQCIFWVFGVMLSIHVY